MSGIKLVSDTNPLIYILNGNSDLSLVASEILDSKQVWISIISELELFSKKGLTRQELKEIERLVQSCFVININEEIKEICKSIIQKYSLKLPDSIIAATSIYLDVPLVTADVSFRRLKDLHVILLEA